MISMIDVIRIIIRVIIIGIIIVIVVIVIIIVRTCTVTDVIGSGYINFFFPGGTAALNVRICYTDTE